MKKVYKIFLFLIVLIFLTTYAPNKFDLTTSEKKNFYIIKNIEIVNNDLVHKDLIQDKLNHLYKKNIFLIKREDIEKPLKGIDFLEKVEVKKKYPDTIILKIFETKPAGILFKNKKKYLLDSSSNLVAYDENLDSGLLPSIFGDKAENNFIDFLKKLKNNNFPNEKILSFYYFQIERWDLKLKDNRTIKFPYKNIDDAIIKSIELLNREDFSNYNIIDLRIDGKIIVE